MLSLRALFPSGLFPLFRCLFSFLFSSLILCVVLFVFGLAGDDRPVSGVAPHQLAVDTHRRDLAVVEEDHTVRVVQQQR